jgi:MtaA/CmuA family methyltransferase
MTGKEIFLNALQRKKNPRPAIGNPVSIACTELMDKVGAPFPEAHLNADKMAELAIGGHTIMGFDNVMPLFSVVHESASLGVSIDWGQKNTMPSVKGVFCTEPEEIDNSDAFLESPYARTPLDAIRMIKKELHDAACITGKVFGPWTLAYHIFGIENFLICTCIDINKTKRILDRLKVVTIKYAKEQLAAGADCITVADHATRDLCSPETYRDFVFPIHKEIVREIRCPLILHICGYTLDRIQYINQTGFSCFHYDSKNDDLKIRKEATSIALAGGTNNIQLLLSGKENEIIKDIEQKIKTGIEIIGPECAIPLNTPLKNICAFGKYFKTILYCKSRRS